MKASVYERYGSPDDLQLRDVMTPSPKDDEVLMRTHATTVTTGDWRARSLEMPRGFGLMSRRVFGVFKPRQPVLGTEVAGIVGRCSRLLLHIAGLVMTTTAWRAVSGTVCQAALASIPQFVRTANARA